MMKYSRWPSDLAYFSRPGDTRPLSQFPARPRGSPVRTLPALKSMSSCILLNGAVARDLDQRRNGTANHTSPSGHEQDNL
jgi:hypothetical protein